jgi:HEPN domain-containing protein
MTPEQWRLREVGRWLRIAARDLHAARLLAGPEPSPSIFHSQQAAEKAAKAFLTAHDVVFDKTHDIEVLTALVTPLNESVAKATAACESLTPHAVVLRYSEAPEEPDEAEALDAIARAQRRYDEVTAALGLDKP